MKKILALIIAVILQVSAFGQCAMCKATAESNMNGGDSMAAGLNVGIMYLMFIPYLLIAGLAYAFYRHRKKSKKEDLA